MDRACRFSFPPILLSPTGHPHAPTQGKWRGFEEGAGPVGDHFPPHRQGNRQHRCSRGPRSAKGPRSAAARPPPLPCSRPANPLNFVGDAQMGALLQAARGARSGMFSGSTLPIKGQRTLSSGASLPLGSSGARHFSKAPNFPITLPQPREAGVQPAKRPAQVPKPGGTPLLFLCPRPPGAGRAAAHARPPASWRPTWCICPCAQF